MFNSRTLNNCTIVPLDTIGQRARTDNVLAAAAAWSRPNDDSDDERDDDDGDDGDDNRNNNNNWRDCASNQSLR